VSQGGLTVTDCVEQSPMVQAITHGAKSLFDRLFDVWPAQQPFTWSRRNVVVAFDGRPLKVDPVRDLSRSLKEGWK